MNEEVIRVLLVDDQALLRSALALIIDADPGLKVVGQAGNGLEAVNCVAELKPDVVLMDIRMPEMDGVEATRRICAAQAPLPATYSYPSPADEEQPHSTRVLVLTTFNLDDRAATAIRLGASGFLLKDATPAMLRDAIRTVHGGNAVLSPTNLAMLMEGQFRERTPLPGGYSELTTREREILVLVGQGLANNEIAQQLYVSESTVKSHVSAVLRKLLLRDRVQIVVFAHEHGLCRS